MLDVRFQPMTVRVKRPAGRTHRTRASFKEDGTGMLADLERELYFLKATDVVIESGHQRTDIRNDGWPKSTATAQFSDIRLYFKCKHGDLRYECAEFDRWRANLRAIGLWLHRQRLAIEEWGIGSGGEAYKGFAALPDKPHEEFTTAEDAARFIVSCGTLTMNPEHVLGNQANLRLAFREAARALHPDSASGDADKMSKLNRARDFIEKHAAAGVGT